ncbi:hypothetical protein EDC15_12054 [Acetobacter aceti NBRC 14818]|uniref:hypothetical protein n=1 Tax=Acetobacter aceti TaxID=435 RepID=UPI0010E32010|nr:hypothetical protein [Acetobacter aceti]TCS29669.1 hypothetical protein EDC15_12054 [Acetobacter aceti NBRC 14818]
MVLAVVCPCVSAALVVWCLSLGRSILTSIRGKQPDRTGAFIQKRFCFLDVGSLPVCQEKSHSHSRSIDYGVDFGDPEENPLSAPTVCHSDHTGAFTLSVKTEKNITGQAEVQASVPPPSPVQLFVMLPCRISSLGIGSGGNPEHITPASPITKYVVSGFHLRDNTMSILSHKRDRTAEKIFWISISKELGRNLHDQCGMVSGCRAPDLCPPRNLSVCRMKPRVEASLCFPEDWHFQ